MSIIYDALKKAQNSIHGNFQTAININKADPKTKVLIIALYILMVCCGLILGNFIFGYITRPKLSAAKGPQPIVKPLPIEKLPAKATPINMPAKTETPVKEPPHAPAVSESENKTEPNFVLNGIFFSENKGFALINNNIVKIGDTVEGALVTRITADEVELNSAGATIKLNRSR